MARTDGRDSEHGTLTHTHTPRSRPPLRVVSCSCVAAAVVLLYSEGMVSVDQVAWARDGHATQGICEGGVCDTRHPCVRQHQGVTARIVHPVQ